MKNKFKLDFKAVLTASVLLLVTGFLFGGTSFAGDHLEMIIDVETAEFHIDKLDISDLETGDVETIYTEDGKTIDVMKTATGVDIFIDGEKLDLPGTGIHAMHADGEGVRHIIVHIECEGEADADCAAEEHGSLFTSDHASGDGTIYHKIIIKKELHTSDEI